MIPVFSHRYIPSEPCLPGNPVFSIMGTDILYYGYDLTSYFFAEFQVPAPAVTAMVPRHIAFWSELFGAVWNDPPLTPPWWSASPGGVDE